jgi:hypothetical protein
MVQTVVRNYHWPPNVIRGLFIDKEDYNGLVFWYNDIEAQTAHTKKKLK